MKKPKPKKPKYNMQVVDGKPRRLPGNETQRFWSKIKSNNGCWDFVSNQDKDGYGRFKCFENGAWVNRRAHRIMFSKLHGEIPKGMQILHKCDRPSCCNPSHLFAGTAKDNTQDMMKKGRNGFGNAKLTNEKVIEIKLQLSSGISMNVIAESFGVVPETICAIKRGRTWRRVS